jgi:cytochrome c-type biogenesis protein CcmH/NrfF
MRQQRKHGRQLLWLGHGLLFVLGVRLPLMRLRMRHGSSHQQQQQQQQQQQETIAPLQLMLLQASPPAGGAPACVRLRG